MYLDTLDRLRHLGAPLDRLTQATVYAHTDAEAPKPVLHLDSTCAYRCRAEDQVELAVAELRADRLCPQCRETPPFGFSWLAGADILCSLIEAVARQREALSTELVAVLAGGVPTELLFTLTSRAQSLRRLSGRVPSELRRWSTGPADAAAATLADARAQLRADESWVTRLTGLPAGNRRYVYLPWMAAAGTAPLKLAVAVYSDLGEGEPIDFNATPLLVAAPTGLPTEGNDKCRDAGPALPDDPAELPELALRLHREAPPGSPLADVAAAIIAARGILRT